MAGPQGKDTPRWEWRTFSNRLADIEAKIGLAVQIAPRQSDEVYLLNSTTPHSAKIRDGVLEVKRLQQVDSSGLEPLESGVQSRLSAFGARITISIYGAGPPTAYNSAWRL